MKNHLASDASDSKNYKPVQISGISKYQLNFIIII